MIKEFKKFNKMQEFVLSEYFDNESVDIGCKRICGKTTVLILIAKDLARNNKQTLFIVNNMAFLKIVKKEFTTEELKYVHFFTKRQAESPVIRGYRASCILVDEVPDLDWETNLNWGFRLESQQRISLYSY